MPYLVLFFPFLPTFLEKLGHQTVLLGLGHESSVLLPATNHEANLPS